MKIRCSSPPSSGNDTPQQGFGIDEPPNLRERQVLGLSLNDGWEDGLPRDDLRKVRVGAKQAYRVAVSRPETIGVEHWA